MNQFIAVYSSNGDVISNIKYYDGFMGQRIGAISCLAFHPYWVPSICIELFFLGARWFVCLSMVSWWNVCFSVHLSLICVYWYPIG